MSDIFRIENEVLYGCNDENIVSAVIPEGVETIYARVFMSCKSLKSVVFPDSVDEIYNDVFLHCKKLESVVFGKNLEKLWWMAFYGCTSLQSIEFRGTVAQWEAVEGKAEVFSMGVPATCVKCADGVWERPAFLMEGGVLERYLDYEAEYAEIPDSVTKLGYKVFRDCKALKTITLGDNITYAPSEAFKGLRGDFEIICTENSTTYKTLKKRPKLRAHVKSLAKEDAKDKKIAQVQQATADAVIKSFFEENADSEVLTLSSKKSATVVLARCGANSAVFKLGADCSKWLGKAKTCIEALSDSTKSGAEIYEAIKSSKLPLSSIPKKAQENLTLKTDAAGNLRLFCKDDVYDIFPNATVEHAELFGAMKIRGWKSLSDCEKLSSVVIGDDVCLIDVGTFSQNKKLSKLEISESVEMICNNAFRDCAIEEFSHPLLTIKNGVAIRDSKALYRANCAENVVIPDGVTEIETQAFESSRHLLSVVIPKSVEKIGCGAFCDCESLSSVTVLGNITEVGYAAFRNCNIENLSLACLNIKNGLAVENGKVLYFTKPAEKVVIPEGVEKIENSAFSECRTLLQVVICDGVCEIGGSAFSYCSRLTSVAFPKSLKKIGDWSFVDCTGLKTIEFGGTVAEWNAVEKPHFWWNNGGIGKYVKCSDGEVRVAD